MFTARRSTACLKLSVSHQVYFLILCMFLAFFFKSRTHVVHWFYLCLCLCPLVSVGFEYESCPDLILWEKRTAVLQGYETTASKLGGWTIDKHHALNIQSGESTRKPFLNDYSHPLFQMKHLLKRYLYTARNLHFYTLFIALLGNHLSLWCSKHFSVTAVVLLSGICVSA